jgi:hypothetical protein
MQEALQFIFFTGFLIELKEKIYKQYSTHTKQLQNKLLAY